MKHSFLLILLLSIFSCNFTIFALPALAQQAFEQEQNIRKLIVQKQQVNFVPAAGIAPASLEPLTLSANMRRPFLFFREQANHRLPLARLFIFLIIVAALAKILTPVLIKESNSQIQENFFSSIAYSLVYTTLVLTAARFAFQTPGEALVPLGIFCIGLVQASYVIGVSFAVNLFAAILTSKIFAKLNFSKPRACLVYALSLMLVALALTLITTLPEVWRFPRIGNRIVFLVAMIGLGGLIARLRTRPVAE